MRIVLDPTSAGLLVGVLAPLLTAVVQQPRWSSSKRRIVAVVIAGLLGALTAYGQGAWAGSEVDLFGTVMVVLVASQATYGTLWRKVVPAIEAATTRQPAAVTYPAAGGYVPRHARPDEVERRHITLRSEPAADTPGAQD